MNELLNHTIPTEVGEALLFACGLLLMGLLGLVVGTATERTRTRRDLQDVFTDPDTAKAIFVARWFAGGKNGVEEYAEELWNTEELFQQESEAVARAVHELVTAELGL